MYPSEAAGWEDALFTALHALLFTSCQGVWAQCMGINKPGHRKKGLCLRLQVLKLASPGCSQDIWFRDVSYRVQWKVALSVWGWPLQLLTPASAQETLRSVQHREHLPGCILKETRGHLNLCLVSWKGKGWLEQGRWEMHSPAPAQQTQSLSETLVEASAFPLLWTLSKTTTIF